jgi:hypothetical protein
MAHEILKCNFFDNSILGLALQKLIVCLFVGPRKTPVFYYVRSVKKKQQESANLSVCGNRQHIRRLRGESFVNF